MEDLTSVIIAGAVAILPVIFAIVARQLQRYLISLEAQVENRIGSDNWDLVERLAWKMVAAAEQTTGLDSGEKKKAWVYQRLVNFCVDYQIPITPEQINALIEGTVHEYGQWNGGPAVLEAS